MMATPGFVIFSIAVFVNIVVLVVSLQTVEVPLQSSLNPERNWAGVSERQGHRLIADYGCGSCHKIPGVTQADGKVGPPLEGFANRAYIAGRIPNTQNNLVAWIINPQQIDPQTAMPNLGVTAQEARSIAAYLHGLE
jgi:cytochrome c